MVNVVDLNLALTSCGFLERCRRPAACRPCTLSRSPGNRRSRESGVVLVAVAAAIDARLRRRGSADNRWCSTVPGPRGLRRSGRRSRSRDRRRSVGRSGPPRRERPGSRSVGDGRAAAATGAVDPRGGPRPLPRHRTCPREVAQLRLRERGRRSGADRARDQLPTRRRRGSVRPSARRRLGRTPRSRGSRSRGR